jgi:hypothetical protein
MRSLARTGLGLLAAAVLLLALAVAGAWAAEPAKKCDAAKPAAALVYLGAWDCPYCTKWKAEERPKFAASAEAKRIQLREFDTPRLKSPDFKFSPDLAWLDAKYRTKKGVPRFLVVRDGAVLSEAYGLSGWREKTLPVLRELAAKPC